MIPYAISSNGIPKEDVDLLEKIGETVRTLPDVNLGVSADGKKIVLSCHILARALAQVFSLEFKDGYFYPNFEHSWLITPRDNIIDAYPVGMLISSNGGPILIDGDNCSPARWLYKERKEVTRRFLARWNNNAVNKIIESLRCNEREVMDND